MKLYCIVDYDPQDDYPLTVDIFKTLKDAETYFRQMVEMTWGIENKDIFINLTEEEINKIWMPTEEMEQAIFNQIYIDSNGGVIQIIEKEINV